VLAVFLFWVLLCLLTYDLGKLVVMYLNHLVVFWYLNSKVVTFLTLGFSILIFWSKYVILNISWLWDKLLWVVIRP
jgi:hypothetical protein